MNYSYTWIPQLQYIVQEIDLPEKYRSFIQHFGVEQLAIEPAGATSRNRLVAHLTRYQVTVQFKVETRSDTIPRTVVGPVCGWSSTHTPTSIFWQLNFFSTLLQFKITSRRVPWCVLCPSTRLP